jgi:hypothetical protein
MKQTYLIGLLVFSLLINLGVAGTLVWHVTQQQKTASVPLPPGDGLTAADVNRIRSMWPQEKRRWMFQAQQDLVAKKAELLESIANNPGNLQACEPQIKDFLALRVQMERQALERISVMMSALPAERRPTFMVFLKNRASNENAGMSSDKAGENPAHRKSKISWVKLVFPG